MVEWLAGNRIRGTTAERTSTTNGFNPVDALTGGWKKLTSSTSVYSSGNEDTITITGLDNKKYYMVLVNTNGSGNTNAKIRIGFGGTISTSGYCNRYQINGTGGSGNSQDGANKVNGNNTTGTDGSNYDWYIIENISGKEKLIMGWNGSTKGTSTDDVERAEMVTKHTGTGVMDSIQLINDLAGANFDTGTEVVVLGWDPADTHTDNFWTKLATATGSSSSASFDTGTFAAKKYLFVTAYAENTNDFKCIFNDGASGTYTRRYSGNFANDVVGTSSTHFGLSWGTTKVFFTQMIANPSNSYKIIHQTGSEVATDNSVGTQPTSFDSVTQWRNNAQITKMSFSRAGGNFSGDEKIIVWGSD